MTNKNRQKKQKSSQKRIGLFLGLAIICLLILMIGLMRTRAQQQITLGSADVCEGETCEFIDIKTADYEKLIAEKKSFILFVDQGGCSTADEMRSWSEQFMKEHKIKIYKMMFNDLKDSSLHQSVKYYPSVVIVSKGKVSDWLRADTDGDIDFYNDMEKFNSWLKERVKI